MQTVVPNGTHGPVTIDRPDPQPDAVPESTSPSTALGPTAAKPPTNAARRRGRPDWLLAGLTALLVVALVAGAVFARTTLAGRDDTITGLRDDVAALTSARQTLEGNLTAVSGERDSLQASVAELTAERQVIFDERDAALTERDDLQDRVDTLERELTVARDDASRARERADAAQGDLATYGALMRIDGDIIARLAQSGSYLGQSYTAYMEGDYATAQTLLDQTHEELDALEALMDRRSELLDQLSGN